MGPPDESEEPLGNDDGIAGQKRVFELDSQLFLLAVDRADDFHARGGTAIRDAAGQRQPLEDGRHVLLQRDGDWAPTDTRLDELELRRLPSGAGPEDVAVDAEGRLLAGGDDGWIWRWPAAATAATAPEPLVRTGGRPLGIEVDPRDGSIVICDAHRGLLRLAGDVLTELATEAAGSPIVFCNNASVARDGTIYFSDSSDRYPITAWRRDFLERRPNGRLLAWSPESGTVDVVASGLHFPNGVSLTPDESTVVVAETSMHRLLTVPLAGGEPSVLLDLPAYPDNLSTVGDGTFWVALASPRLPIAESLLPHPRVRQLAALLPQRLQPQPKRYGIVALIDVEGGVRRTVHGPRGGYFMPTGVRQSGADLFVGSLVEPAVGHLRL